MCHLSFNMCTIYTDDGASAKFIVLTLTKRITVNGEGQPRGKRTWGFIHPRIYDENILYIYVIICIYSKEIQNYCTGIVSYIYIVRKDILVPSMRSTYYNFSIAKLCLNIMFLILKFPCSMWTLAWKNPQDSISGNWFSCYCFPIRGLGYGTSIFSIFTIS